MEEARRGKKRGKREPLWKNGREKESVGKGMEETKWVKKNGEGEKEAAATWLRDNQRLRSRKGDRERRKRDLKRETKEDREKDSSLRERYRGEACPRPESLRIVFDAAHSLERS